VEVFDIAGQVARCTLASSPRAARGKSAATLLRILVSVAAEKSLQGVTSLPLVRRGTANFSPLGSGGTAFATR
jgi:hypothetical protein